MLRDDFKDKNHQRIRSGEKQQQMKTLFQAHLAIRIERVRIFVLCEVKQCAQFMHLTQLRPFKPHFCIVVQRQ